jgi:DNA repair ATPase RecN
MAQAGPASGSYNEALISTLTDQLERLQRTMRQQHENQISEQGHLRSLAETVAALNDNVKSHHVLLAKLTQLQNETTPALSQLTEVIMTSNASRVEEHVRSVDISLKEISQQLSNSADNNTTLLRDELRTIARLIAADNQKNDPRVN